jgi:hypothetical protein
MAAVLEQERGGDGRISRVDVNGGAVLPGVEKYFSEVAVLKATGASRIPDAGVLKLDKLVFASVRKPPTGWDGLRHCRPSKPSPGALDVGVLCLR